MKAPKCICDEMAQKMGFSESRTFTCPSHGQITIDRRFVAAPITFPSQPITIPANPNPWIAPWAPTGAPTGAPFYPSTPNTTFTC